MLGQSKLIRVLNVTLNNRLLMIVIFGPVMIAGNRLAVTVLVLLKVMRRTLFVVRVKLRLVVTSRRVLLVIVVFWWAVFRRPRWACRLVLTLLTLRLT